MCPFEDLPDVLLCMGRIILVQAESMVFIRFSTKKSWNGQNLFFATSRQDFDFVDYGMQPCDNCYAKH